MLEKIREIMTRYVDLEPEEIREDSRLVEDLALTSFAIMGMIGGFEAEFGITVDTSELTAVHTVGDIAAYIRSKQA